MKSNWVMRIRVSPCGSTPTCLTTTSMRSRIGWTKPSWMHATVFCGLIADLAILLYLGRTY
jgi:hypothetical protein